MTEAIRQKLASYKGLMLDADGVFFTGEEHRVTLPDGTTSISKTRHFHDGQGLSFLRALGIRIVFATGEGEPLSGIVQKLNELPSVRSGEWAPIELFTGELKKGGKVSSLETWLQKHHLTWSECVYIGDDRNDLEAMERAGLKIAPANARRLILQRADIVTKARGGEGAIREFAEITLDARGIDETTLSAA